ncbi:MAG: type II secretion system protein GspD [Bacillota bacterium]
MKQSKRYGLINNINIKLLFSLLVLSLFCYTFFASGMIEASENGQGSDELITLTVRSADINDVLMMLTEQSGINLVPDETVSGNVTIELRDVTIQAALRTLTIAYGYNFEEISDNIYMVSSDGFEQPATIDYSKGNLTLRIEGNEVRDVLNEIAEKADIDIIMDRQVEGQVSANLTDVPLEVGLTNFLQTNGFSYSKNNGIYRVFRNQRGGNSDLSISVVDDMVSIDVQQANLGDILNTIARLGNLNMVLFSGVRDVVDLKVDDVPISEAIELILSGTRFTYRKVNGVYLVGDKNVSSPTSTILTMNKMIPLEYLQAELIPQLLPNNFPASNVKVIKEQNALLATGTQSQLSYLQEYIEKIDTKTPQIVVEALIVEFTNNSIDDTGIDFGIENDVGDGEKETIFTSSVGELTLNSIMDLNSDFYLKINAMVDNNNATIKARPNITTLNGQQANIDVSDVNYYAIKKNNEDGSSETTYESYNAGISLEVTPWVSSSGEITMKLHPTVSDIKSGSGDGPKPLGKREVNTTVRVKDGNTIVIGGLIQDTGSFAESKVPILGDIPYIGQLFKNDSEELRQTELVMFITPRVLNPADENVEEKAQEMSDKADKINQLMMQFNSNNDDDDIEIEQEEQIQQEDETSQEQE